MDTIRANPNGKDNGNKVVVYIVCGVLALLLIGGGIFFLTRNDNEPQNDGTEWIDDEEDDATAIDADGDTPSGINIDSLRQALADEKERRESEHQHSLDSLQRLADSLQQEADRRQTTVPGATTSTGNTSRQQAGSGNLDLGWGIYEGPMQSGKAHGVGGTISVTAHHNLDLKTADGQTIDLEPGDQLVNVKMSNGRIVQALLKRADGSQRWIIIG